MTNFGLNNLPARLALGALACLTSTLTARAQSTPPASSPPPAAGAPASPGLSVPPPIVQTSPPLFLGYHKPKSLPSGEITLMNNGDKPLKITETKGDCACTDVFVEKNELAPGESTILHVGVDVPRELGPIRRDIRVICEGYTTPFVTGVALEAGFAVRVNGGGGRSVIADKIGILKLDAVDGRPFHVLALNGEPPEYMGQTIPPEGAVVHTIRYDWSRKAGDLIPRWMIVETDHPDASMFSVKSMVDGYRPLQLKTKWFVLEERVLLGQIPGDSTAESSVTLSGKPLIGGQKITITSSNAAIPVRITGLRKPDRGGGIMADIQVTPQAGYRGFFWTVVEFKLGEDTAAFDLYGHVGEPTDPRIPAAER